MYMGHAVVISSPPPLERGVEDKWKVQLLFIAALNSFAWVAVVSRSSHCCCIQREDRLWAVAATLSRHYHLGRWVNSDMLVASLVKKRHYCHNWGGQFLMLLESKDRQHWQGLCSNWSRRKLRHKHSWTMKHQRMRFRVKFLKELHRFESTGKNKCKKPYLTK